MIKKLGYFLIYVGVPFGIPALLMQFSGSLLFLFYPVWLFISYKFIQKSCEDREPINWMEHTDAMGWVFAFGMPAIVSAVVYFTYHVVKLDYLLSDVLSTGSTALDLILLVASIYYIYKFMVRPILKEVEKKAKEKDLRGFDVIDRDKSKKFKLPETNDSKHGQLAEPLPRITQKRLDNLIEWARKKYSYDKKKKLSELMIINDLEIKLKVLSEEIPCKLLGYYETSGVIKNNDFEFLSKRIITQEFFADVYDDDNWLTLENWVQVIANPETYPVYIWQDYDGQYSEDTDYDNVKPNLTTNYYLSIDETEYISKYGDTGNEFVTNTGNENKLIGYKLVSVEYPQDLYFNEKCFGFKENEKEYLVTLLMASYKPSLLKRILTELDK